MAETVLVYEDILTQLADHYENHALKVFESQQDIRPDDDEMLDMFESDYNDHLDVADHVRHGRLDAARHKLRGMDTAARENCPGMIYNFLCPDF